MKLIALGDTHGRTHWQLLKSQDYDKAVFIGDYFDTREGITPEAQLANFNDIIDYKKANRQKVILLLGNHDFHYTRIAGETYSQYQRLFAHKFQEVLLEALEDNLIRLCYTHEHYLFSHAGLTKTWLANYNYNQEPLDQFVNDLFKIEPQAFRFQKGRMVDPYGDNVFQGPMWVRPQSLSEDAVDGFIQVVGHTTQHSINPVGNILLIDTLGTSNEYISITNGQLAVEKVLVV